VANRLRRNTLIAIYHASSPGCARPPLAVLDAQAASFRPVDLTSAWRCTIQAPYPLP